MDSEVYRARYNIILLILAIRDWRVISGIDIIYIFTKPSLRKRPDIARRRPYTICSILLTLSILYYILYAYNNMITLV